MKRFFALAALVLGMVSCQTEPEGLDVIVGGEQDVTINVTIPETETRATAGSNSAVSAFSDLIATDTYVARYIFEVYYEGNMIERQVKYVDAESTSFRVRLIPERDYQFVVWTDIVEAEGAQDGIVSNNLHYVIGDTLQDITLNNTWVAMDESRDAFTATYPALNFNGAQSINIELVRPLAKLRVVTTDCDDILSLYNLTATHATVQYTTEHRTAFNAFTGKAAEADGTKTHTTYEIATYGNEDNTRRTIFTDYFFAENDVVNFIFTVYDNNGEQIKMTNFNTPINVRRNYLTTLEGNVLTDGNDIGITVNPGFGNNGENVENYTVITSASELLAVMNTDGEYVVGNDIVITANAAATSAVTRTGAASNTTIINLNGYTITVENKTDEALITLTDGQTIVFEGEGEITLTNDSTAPFINADAGCVVVESGEVKNNAVVGDNFFEIENNEEESLALLQYICDNGGTFTFTQNLAGNVTVVQKEGVKVNIDGNGFKFNGEFRVHSNSNYYAGAALTIKNVNFETSTAEVNFIEALENGSERYSQNITVEDCTFTATGEAVNKAVAVQVKASRNVTVKGCTATNLHSLLQAQSCNTGNVKVINCTINGKGGVAFKAVKYAFVEGTTINATGYGIRFDGDNPNYSIVVKDNKVTATQPLIVRRMTSQNNTITLEGTNTLTTESAYQIVITNGEDDAAYAIPTGTYTLTGAEGYSIFPMYADVYTEEDLVNAFDNGANFITLCDDITLNDAWTPVGNSENPWYGVFDGKGYTIDGLTVAGVEYAAFISHSAANSCIKNVSFTNVNLQSTKHAATVVCVAEEGLTLENITVTGEITAASYAGGIMHNGVNATITNCVNNANITANRAGGIASWVTTGANIENVTNNGKITGSVGASGIAHGFAGSIKNATNNGDISSAYFEAAGGIVGVQKAASTYEYCYNYGNVTSTYDDPNASAAGILGQSAGATSTLKYCANYGTITAEQSAAAGIAYSLYGTINASYCYNEGAVEGADSAGGIAPKAAFGAGDKANYCLNAGVITSANGIVYQGSNNNTSSFYYNGGVLYNVTGNTEADADTALQILNGGADTDFFSMENSMITVK